MNGDSKSVYAIVLKYPESNKIDLYSIRDMVNSQTKVNLLGYDKEIEVRRSDIVKVERVNVLSSLQMTNSENFVTIEFPSPFYSYKISRFTWSFKFSIE